MEGICLTAFETRFFGPLPACSANIQYTTLCRSYFVDTCCSRQVFGGGSAVIIGLLCSEDENEDYLDWGDCGAELRKDLRNDVLYVVL